ncbi:MAG: sulfatase-like hydrolase/transferase, partial [Planctomycetaceae bacterium]|nr:sulfatase-like hydrolase/transferase [Planctomycetaceae bacterium]
MLLFFSTVVFSTLLCPPVDTLAANTQTTELPNIVFFFTDDQTTSTLGCYGNPVVQTPNIDMLAREGTRFDNACVSQAICWVSRTTILSGLTGRSFGTSSNPDTATLAAVETLY